MCAWYFFFFKQKTAYEMRISDWSSDVCSSDLPASICFISWAASRSEVSGVHIFTSVLMHWLTFMVPLLGVMKLSDEAPPVLRGAPSTLAPCQGSSIMNLRAGRRHDRGDIMDRKLAMKGPRTRSEEHTPE